jgi:Tfp pilus assembly protein PilX
VPPVYRFRRDQRGQSLVIVLSLITILFLLGSALAVHASAALRATRASAGQGNDFYAADAATELGIWWQRNGKAGNPPAQTINGITTSTTITSVGGGGGGSCPGTTPTVTWMNGFETGNIPASNYPTTNNTIGWFTYVRSAQAGFTGTVDTVASPARTGSRSMRIVPPSGAETYAYQEAPYGITLGPTVVVHAAIRLGSLPTSDGSVLSISPANVSGWGHQALYLMYRPGSGKWALALGNSTILNVFQDSNVTAAVDTWYSFDIRFNVTASNVRLGELYIDGVAQPSITYTDSPGSGTNPRVAFGQYFTPTSMRPDYTAYYDDVVISVTPGDFPIGDINISPLKVDGFGTHVNPTNFQQYDTWPISATSWQMLDELPMTTNTDAIRQITASGTSYIEVTFEDTTQTCIRGADLIMYTHPSGTSANNHKTSAFDGSTETVVYQGDMSVYNTFLAYATKPITPGGAWTQARVNGLKSRFGYGTDVNPNNQWDGLAIEVAWANVSGGPATVTIVGTGGGSTTTTTYADAGAGIPTLDTWTVTK